MLLRKSSIKNHLKNLKDFLRNRALKKSNSFLEFVFFEFGCLRLQTKFGLDRFSRFDYLLDRDGQTEKQINRQTNKVYM